MDGERFPCKPDDARAVGRAEFLVGESPFGADQGDHRRGCRGHGGGVEQPATGMSDYNACACGHLGEQPFERAARRDLHERVAATLLAGFDHHPFEPYLRGGGCLRHAAGRLKRHESRRSQFREFLDHPLLAVSLGKRDGERERDCNGDRIDRRFGSVEFHAIPSERRHPCRPLAAPAVEE